MEFSIGDATYHYEISGEGQPIVLLHGFTGSHATWSNFVSKWKADFQLITIDLPGHGRTRIDTPRTMETCCNDLRQLFDHLNLTAFHLVGYSMGGRTALSFAILYPHYISSLILESASPGLHAEDDRRQRIMNDEKLAQKIETEGVPAFVEFWGNIPLFATQRKLPNDLQQAIRQERLSQSERGLATSLRGMGSGSQPSWWRQLTEITIPVLLIVGEFDEKFVKINEQMKKSLPRADLVTVKNVGHAIHVEDPVKFGKLVRAFILKHDSQGGF
jgi:2-succinyl-6-hydroxy-2,4-cyclohexadiene-1-carboxylate synthase